jgi:hypothetical protein
MLGRELAEPAGGRLRGLLVDDAVCRRQDEPWSGLPVADSRTSTS